MFYVCSFPIETRFGHLNRGCDLNLFIRQFAPSARARLGCETRVQFPDCASKRIANAFQTDSERINPQKSAMQTHQTDSFSQFRETTVPLLR